MNLIDQELAEKFRRMSIQHRHALERASISTGLCRSQHHLLMTISRKRKSSQKELADELELTPAAITLSLKKLEKDGYVQRIIDPADNRYHQIDLTAEGEEIVRKSFEIFQKVDTSLFEKCTEEEKKVLLTCLDKMYESLAGTDQLPEGETQI
ncbi:MAG: MarR family winged helix-turn-helix transcriptional regulator [Candidatus Merdivicinus sp.]|jgi:DNA-binding MarR family transcriptional regulator